MRMSVNTNATMPVHNEFKTKIKDLKLLQRKLSESKITTEGSKNKSALANAKDKSEVKDIGICLTIPYTSTDAEKQVANNEILQEWIRYYLRLRMKVR